jgi:antitoxin (DNA-binding transcriptional repressor) of toxin-antitoxin stability system
MTTRFIGLKELRHRLTHVASRARLRRERVIVLRKNEPIFELRPLSKKDAILERLAADLKKAERDVKAGRLYSQRDVERALGL